jgi:hypothetical protein
MYSRANASKASVAMCDRKSLKRRSGKHVGLSIREECLTGKVVSLDCTEKSEVEDNKRFTAVIILKDLIHWHIFFIILKNHWLRQRL